MKKFCYLFLFFSLLILSTATFAQKGYNIEVEIENYEAPEIIFAYQILNRYPVVDTISRTSEGQYLIQADSMLAPGVYMLVLPPNNDFVTLLINEDEQRFSINTDVNDLGGKMKIKGSPDNTLYYDYMNSLGEKVAGLSEYRQKAAESTDPAVQQKMRNAFDQEVRKIRTYQMQIVEQNPNSFTAALIKAELEVEIPEFANASPEEIQYQKYAYRKNHYFDFIDMSDNRLARSETLFDKVTYYMDKLTHANVDSVKVSIDKVLGLMPTDSENFKYYLDHLMVTYASSDIIGMDGVFVHIVENYYAKGLAPWVDKKDLEEMVDDVTRRKKILIGNIAPDIKMQLRDGKAVSLHEIESDFTVLYLWQPGCSHCKKSLPFMKEFYEKYKSKGVKIFSGCTKILKKVPECWSYIDENEMGNWINTVDPYLKSRFVQLYLAEKTPKIYILDKEKRIVMKDITAEQLEEVMQMLIQEKERNMVPSGRSR